MAQLDLFPVAVHLRRVDPVRNMCRFYTIGLQPDLFGGCTLVREWGRLGSAGTIHYDIYPNEGAAVDALLAHVGRKERGGYKP